MSDISIYQGLRPLVEPPYPFYLFVWMVRLDGLFGWSVWMVRLDGPFGWSVWMVRLVGPAWRTDLVTKIGWLQKLVDYKIIYLYIRFDGTFGWYACKNYLLHSYLLYFYQVLHLHTLTKLKHYTIHPIAAPNNNINNYLQMLIIHICTSLDSFY